MIYRRFFIHSTAKKTFPVADIFFFLLIACSLVFYGCTGASGNENRYLPHRDAPKSPQLTEQEACAFIDVDYAVIPGFVTHLPLFIIDNTRAELTVIDNSGNNRPGDSSVVVSGALIQPLGDTGARNPKGHYLLTLINEESGTKAGSALMGLENVNEFLLTGSTRDKSLMRNYIAFCLASELYDAIPEARFCEVLIRENEDGALLYQGVYLFLDNTGGNIRMDSQYTSDLYAGIFGLQSVINSDIHKTFITYRKLIDVDSFIDFFILNEFLQNYFPRDLSDYMYTDRDGVIKLGFFWDNYNILGNNIPLFYEPTKITMQDTAFFNRITKDAAFLDMLEKRYSGLRRNAFSEAAVITLINNTAAYLGPASMRDWKRWERFYTVPQATGVSVPFDPEGVIYTQTTAAFEQELIKMRYLSVHHGSVIGDSIHRMSWQENLFDSSYNSDISIIFIVVYILVYLLAVRIGRYH